MTAAPRSVPNTPVTGPVSEEQRKLWSQRLQRRVMRLLLVHDQRFFRGQFRAFYTGSELPHLPVFAQYDRFLQLRTLSSELLDDIMPRIRRQLSLQTDQARLVEESPTRGEIDWPRTLQRNWRESPGLVPLSFETRLRQRSSVTPENLFTVAVLLTYRTLMRAFLNEAFAAEMLSAEERQVLTANDEHAERELAAAYARALVERAGQSDVDTLARQVEARLRPGPNPYRDLLAWWQRFAAFQVGRGNARRGPTLAPLRTDEKADAWLYELWIMLEILHVLDEAGAFPKGAVRVSVDRLNTAYTWAGQHLHLTYNRKAEDASGERAGWTHGPGVRPDYAITRQNALPDILDRQQQVIWSEPPVLLDAKYYLAGSDPERTHPAVKKLLGDMTLLGAAQCLLCFPALPEPHPPGPHETRLIERRTERHHSGSPLPIQVRLYRLDPLMPLADLHLRLRTILNHVSTHLAARPTAISCQGVCLDSDTISAGVHLHTASPQILCPKPHIGPGVYDLVRQEDCLTNPTLCHVMGQTIMPPFVLRVTNQAELNRQTAELRARNDQRLRESEAGDDEGRAAQAEQLRANIFTGVGRTVEQYVKLRGNTQSIEEHLAVWVFGVYWRQKVGWALAPATREMLKSGEYVWHEYMQSDGLEDWAAPAVQYCRALELELRRRFFLHEPKAFKVRAGWTIGTPVHALTKRKTDINARTNLRLLLERIAPQQQRAFIRQLRRLKSVHKTRNRLAHSNPLSKADAVQLRWQILGSRDHAGILCWLAEHVQPAHEPDADTQA
ncbi:MAG: hypothetical protein WCP31_02735 [Chloroflexales bacterium]